MTARQVSHLDGDALVGTAVDKTLLDILGDGHRRKTARRRRRREERSLDDTRGGVDGQR